MALIHEYLLNHIQRREDEETYVRSVINMEGTYSPNIFELIMLTEQLREAVATPRKGMNELIYEIPSFIFI